MDLNNSELLNLVSDIRNDKTKYASREEKIVAWAHKKPEMFTRTPFLFKAAADPTADLGHLQVMMDMREKMQKNEIGEKEACEIFYKHVNKRFTDPVIEKENEKKKKNEKPSDAPGSFRVFNDDSRGVRTEITGRSEY